LTMGIEPAMGASW